MESAICASCLIFGIILGSAVTLAIIFARKRNKRYFIRRGLYHDYRLYEYDMNTRKKNLICENDLLCLYGIDTNDFKDLKRFETKEVFLNLED